MSRRAQACAGVRKEGRGTGCAAAAAAAAAVTSGPTTDNKAPTIHASSSGRMSCGDHRA